MTTISGMVTDPDGGAFEGTLVCAPVLWRPSDDGLVSDTAARATVGDDGAVSVVVNADGRGAWRVELRDTKDNARWSAEVVLPESGTVALSTLGLLPSDGEWGPDLSGFLTWADVDSLTQKDSGWRCWPVEDWGPVTIGTQTDIVGQQQWLWRRVGNLVTIAARFKRDTAYTVTSAIGATIVTPHPMHRTDQFRYAAAGYTADPLIYLTGEASRAQMAALNPENGAVSVWAHTTNNTGYVVGEWRAVALPAYITDDPWPDELPGEPYEGSEPTSFLPPPSQPLATVTGVTEAELNDRIASLRGEFNSQLSVMQSQMRMDWLVDFQNGLLDGLRTYDTGWVNLTAFAASSPTTITDQWQIALARRVGDVVDVILGFTLGSGRSGVLGALPSGFHPDAANSAITAMFSPGNTARGDVEIDPQGRVEVFGAGATVGNPYRAVFHYHTNDEFPLTMNRQIGGTL